MWIDCCMEREREREREGKSYWPLLCSANFLSKRTFVPFGFLLLFCYFFTVTTKSSISFLHSVLTDFDKPSILSPKHTVIFLALWDKPMKISCYGNSTFASCFPRHLLAWVQCPNNNIVPRLPPFSSPSRLDSELVDNRWSTSKISNISWLGVFLGRLFSFLFYYRKLNKVM